MKTVAAAGSLLWLLTAMELAWPSMLPRGCLVLPFACGVMFWLRSSVGILLTGMILLLDWIARPTPWPLCSMLLPCAAVLMIAPSVHHDELRARRLLTIPLPLQIPVLTGIALLLQACSELQLAQWMAPRSLPEIIGLNLKTTGVIALPVSAVLSLLVRAADELGLRRAAVV